jgi:chemotaxis signal transduction protein
LRERAERLADRTRQTATRTAVADLTVMRRDGAHFGIETRNVQEVRNVELVTIPGATPVVPGLFQIRGQLYCMVDLLALLKTAPPLAHGVSTLVAVVEGPQGKIGLRIDESLGRRTVYADEVDNALERNKSDFVAFLTRDLLSAVDLAALFRRPELLIGS